MWPLFVEARLLKYANYNSKAINVLFRVQTIFDNEQKIRFFATGMLNVNHQRLLEIVGVDKISKGYLHNILKFLDPTRVTTIRSSKLMMLTDESLHSKQRQPFPKHVSRNSFGFL